MSSVKIINAFGVICAIVLINFCSDNSTNPLDKDFRIYKNARDRWDAYALDKYSINQTVLCYCPNAGEPYKLSVAGDSILSAQNVRTGNYVTDHSIIVFRTVDEIFDLIESVDPDSVAYINVEYHERYGYPTQLYIDYNAQMADEEMGYQMKDLKAE